jgi:hypothetical protein
LDLYKKRLLWQGGSQKMHLVIWSLVCSPKSQGGLGVLNLGYMNDALLTKWLWNLENSNGLWQSIITEKYIKVKNILRENLLSQLSKDRMILSFGKSF